MPNPEFWRRSWVWVHPGTDEDVHLVLKALLVNIPSKRGSILTVRLSFGMGCKV